MNPKHHEETIEGSQNFFSVGNIEVYNEDVIIERGIETWRLIYIQSEKETQDISGVLR